MKKHPKNCSCGSCIDRRNLRSDWNLMGIDIKRAVAEYKGEEKPSYPPDAWENEFNPKNPLLVRAEKLFEERKYIHSFWYYAIYGMSTFSMYPRYD